MSDPTPDPAPFDTTAQKTFIVKRVKILTASIAALALVVAALTARVVTLETGAPPSPTPTVTVSPSPPPSPTPSPSPSPSPSGSPTPIPLPGPEPSGPGGGVFSVTCLLDHQAPDDPVVFHGQPGAAHLHDFFGAVGVDANTEVAKVGERPTTCLHTDDHAAYWAPALVSSSGVVFKPKSIFAYYQTHQGDPARAFPAGLVMIADGFNDPSGKSGFSCSDQGPFEPNPYDCPNKVVGHIHFPDCWTGLSLDSPDHRSHMSYSRNGQCDAAHPVQLVQLRVHVQYVGLRNGSQYHLAPNPDGSFPRLHADFVDGWVAGALERILTACINAGRECKQDTSV